MASSGCSLFRTLKNDMCISSSEEAGRCGETKRKPKFYWCYKPLMQILCSVNIEQLTAKSEDLLPKVGRFCQLSLLVGVEAARGAMKSIPIVY